MVNRMSIFCWFSLKQKRPHFLDFGSMALAEYFRRDYPPFTRQCELIPLISNEYSNYFSGFGKQLLGIRGEFLGIGCHIATDHCLLMMVGLVAEDGHSAVELLDEKRPDHLMRKSHLGNGELSI